MAYDFNEVVTHYISAYLIIMWIVGKNYIAHDSAEESPPISKLISDYSTL